MRDSGHRIHFGQLIDKAFWFLLTSAALYTASEIREMGRSMTELNAKVAVILEKIADGSRRIDGLEKRLERIEDRGRSRDL